MSIETPAALFRLSDFAEHKDPSGAAWAAFQEVDAHITALHAEVERLTRDVERYQKRERHYAKFVSIEGAEYCEDLYDENERLRADLATAQKERDEARGALVEVRDATYYKAVPPGVEAQALAAYINGRVKRALAALPTPPKGSVKASDFLRETSNTTPTPPEQEADDA